MPQTFVRTTDKELVNVFEAGKHYTGYDVGWVESTPLRYGFMLVRDITLPYQLSAEQIVLKLPPEGIVIDEPGASQIVHTQNGGKWIERRGQIAKTITITGTTGFNYEPKVPTIVRKFLPQKTIVDTEGPTSGQGKFLQLRNLFRAYWQIFSDEAYKDQRDRCVFIFINEKDDEQWIVEPTNFRMTRQSPKNKFTYQYEIQMVTIARADDLAFLPDPLTLMSKIAYIRGIVGNIANQLGNWATALDSATAFIRGAMAEIISDIKALCATVQAALDSVARAQKFSLPAEMRAQLGNGYSSDSAAGASISAGTQAKATRGYSLLWQDLLAADEAAEAETGTALLSFSAHEALTNIGILFSTLAGRPELFAETFSNKWAKVLENFDPTYGMGGYDWSLTAPLGKTAVAEAEILPGDDLVSIAARELGSGDRFMELVILNGLKYPYISPSSDSRAQNTLAPGDAILIPATGTLAPGSQGAIDATAYADPTITAAVTVAGSQTCTIDTQGKPFRTNQWAGFLCTVVAGPGEGQELLIASNTADTFTVSGQFSTALTSASVVKFSLQRNGLPARKSAYQQALGVDMKLGSDADLQLSSAGDYALVDGPDNMKQAILSKFNTRQGELPAHPTYGAAFEPGNRAGPDALLAYQVAVRRTLLSDRRIDALENFVATIDGDQIKGQGYAMLTGQSQPLALNTIGSR